MCDIEKFYIDLLDTIAKENGFKNYKMELKKGSNEGDNYFGNLTAITIIGEHKQLDFILKIASTEDWFRKCLPGRNLYLREIYVYEKVFKEFEKFQNDFLITKPFNCYPKLYVSGSEDCKEFLLMENLKLAGYRLLNMRETFSEVHMSEILREFGKLHAVSIAMKEKRPEIFKELSTSVATAPIYEDDLKEIYYGFAEMGLRAVEKNETAREAMRKYMKICRELLESMFSNKNTLIIGHGDAWCNNILFKYQNNGDLSAQCDLRLVDWQNTTMSSPITDISYVMFTCGSKKILYDYRHFLKIYHEALSENLKEFGCDPDELYSFAQLEEDWEKYSICALNFAINLLKCCLKYEGEQGDGIFPYDKYNFSEEYTKRILDLVLFVVDNKLL